MKHLLPLIIIGLPCACVGASAATSAPADTGFADLERQYVVYFLEQFPVVATYLGGAALDPSLADVDSRLRDYSAAALKSEDAKLAQYREAFAAMPVADLSPRRRIDREVAIAQINFLLRQYAVRRYQQRALDSYVDEPFRGVDWQLQGMQDLGAGHYGTEQEWRGVIARMRATPAYLITAQRQIEAGVQAGNAPDWRVLRASGLESAQADAEYFAKTLPGIAADRLAVANRTAFLKEITDAAAEASRAYAAFHEFVLATFFDNAKAEGAAGLKPAYRADHFAFGEIEYDWAVRNNLRLKKSARQLFAEAPPVIATTQAEIVKLAREIAAAHHWSVTAENTQVVRLVIDELRKDAPRSDADMIDWYTKTGERLVDYARKTGLFDVPADYRLDVTLAPPPLRASLDGAAYYPAPAFKATGVGRFYVAPTDNDPAELAQNDRAALAYLAAHEGFPGHDWHYKIMTQYREDISLVRWLTPGAVEDSSSMWQDSMAAEGWALYCEALMAEPQPGAPQGFYSPEERLYQLQGKLYRDVRVRVDTGIHTGRMGFDAAVDLFSQVVDFLPGSCRNPKLLEQDAKRASCNDAWMAIFRYSRWPTQAITYRLGKEQILALRAQAQRQLGAKFSAKRFHVEFMKQGTIPAGYFGAELLHTLRAAP